MGQMDRAETGPPGGGAGTPRWHCPIFYTFMAHGPSFKIMTVETGRSSRPAKN